MIDFLGREISVGDIIVYPGRRGSALWLNSAKVTGIYPGYQKNETDYVWGQIQAMREDTGSTVYLRGSSRVVVV